MPDLEELSYKRLSSLLQAQQEASLDGILVVDENRRILSYNQRFLDLWHIPRALADTMDDRTLLTYVVDQLVDPAAFVAKVNYLYEHDEEVSREEVDLKDGRVFDRYSAPVTGGVGLHYGRVWFFRDVTEQKQAEADLLREKMRSEALLLNILPEVIADRLKAGATIVADDFNEVSVLFADIVGFTEFSNRTAPHKVVDLLNSLFSRFDALAQVHGVEKIKTIGDAYMAVAGLPVLQPDHAERIARMALGMCDAVEAFNLDTQQTFTVRIGINSGPVVAGVIGTKKFIYDLWGDTVNLASRMESHGVPGAIQVSRCTYELLQARFHFVPRGHIHVKGLGDMETFLLQAPL